ncbi:class I SAM-dependent methyltransferase [Brachybacterium sp. Z12]|uniref:class I SAM-dependent methyltransferase n=1 Tax=Brachybacterium sp. Z12 TaxID=2759167 RepID=UPI00223C009D|nr:class I SAM-dependent methyltransferase [Brachybacterium sp. Z12]
MVFDLGTGTGVLAAVLARRGAARVVATDLNPRAVECARDNIQRLGYEDRIEVLEADLYPSGRADLIVCNPPWLPGAPTSTLELGIYDEGSSMLSGFLAGLASHLRPEGEGWLIISDLAEHLRLRSREELKRLVRDAGLEVLGSVSTSPRHPPAQDPHDLLHAARSQEVTTLWRLRPMTR